MITEYISLEALSATLGLPHCYLRSLANEGLIPFLDVNGRKRFCEKRVRDALESIENKTEKMKGTIKCAP